MMPPWSPSSLDKYITCPKQYYEVKVAKNFIEPDTQHTLWGKDVHEALELAVKEGKPLEERFVQFQWCVNLLLAAQGNKFTEMKLAITKDRVPCDFYSSNAWARCVVDFAAILKYSAAIVDHKTGKKKHSDRQLKQNALVLFCHFPSIQVIYTAYNWLKTKEVTKAIYRREDIDSLWGTFSPVLDEMEFSYDNNVWPPKPSGLCKQWCVVTTCAFNGMKNK